MTRKRPWNRVNLPVYSISSCSGEERNLNIITYVTGISMEPKQFVCGIYHHTKTLELVNRRGEFVLQLLPASQYRLVSLLGKQSGYSVNKIERLQKRSLLVEWKGFYVLKDALAWLHLSVSNSFEAGDHKGFLCDLVQWKNQQDGEPLTLDMLRDKGLVRM
ncbi:MAG: flavin reductase [Bacteroidota bacterium]|nr:flavin reductase [Bacteroidota bacterium]